MSQVVFDFSELITHCLHNEEVEFTNAFNPEIDSKIFISELFQNLKSACQETELEELFQQEHFHFIQSSYTKKKVERLVNNPYLKFDRLCQIPLTQEFRLYGNLKRVKHTPLYLFKALVLDPNHLIYNETKFTKLKNLTCLFNQNEECEEITSQKLPKKRKKGR